MTIEVNAVVRDPRASRETVPADHQAARGISEASPSLITRPSSDIT